MESQPEQDPLLGAKQNYNRWSQATEAGRQGHVTRLDLQGEPGVMAMVKTALERGDLSGIASAAQLVIAQRMERRKQEVQGQAGRLDLSIEDRLAQDPQYLALQHQQQILEGGDASPLMDESVFDATMEHLNVQERSKPK